jgi:hypothetical protein
MLLLVILFRVRPLGIKYLLKDQLIQLLRMRSLKIYSMGIFTQQLVEHKISLSYN